MRVAIKDIEVGHWVLGTSIMIDRKFGYPLKVAGVVQKSVIVVNEFEDRNLVRFQSIQAIFTTKEEALGLFNFEQEKWKEYKAIVDKTRADYLQQVKRKLEEM